MPLASADVCGRGRLNDEPKECLRRRLVIIWVITKSDDRAVGLPFVYHVYYDCRPNWTARSLIITN